MQLGGNGKCSLGGKRLVHWAKGYCCLGGEHECSSGGKALVQFGRERARAAWTESEARTDLAGKDQYRYSLGDEGLVLLGREHVCSLGGNGVGSLGEKGLVGRQRAGQPGIMQHGRASCSLGGKWLVQLGWGRATAAWAKRAAARAGEVGRAGKRMCREEQIYHNQIHIFRFDITRKTGVSIPELLLRAAWIIRISD